MESSTTTPIEDRDLFRAKAAREGDCAEAINGRESGNYGRVKEVTGWLAGRLYIWVIALRDMRRDTSEMY